MTSTFKEIVQDIKERVEKLDSGDLNEAEDIIRLCRLIQDASVRLDTLHSGISHVMYNIRDGM